MATFVKTPSGTWKAVVRKRGWPAQIKTFRLKRDAEDWARGVDDEITRGIYIARAPAERMTVAAVLERYLREVGPAKRVSTWGREAGRVKPLRARLGRYALAAVTSDLVARYRDDRLAEGKSNNTVRLELALLSHLYTVAIREWGMGLVYNPVANIRKPSPGAGRTRRLSNDEEARLLKACRAHSNPMLTWIVELALHTAMRAGEIVSLRTDQVDLEKCVVRLEVTKNGSARTVPLSTRAAAILCEALNHIRPEDTNLVRGHVNYET